MSKAKKILSWDYRNVRAALAFFVVLGSLLVLGGIGMAMGDSAAGDKTKPKPGIPPAAVMVAIVGFAGAAGGCAGLWGNRRWAKLAYVMAVPYLIGFPVG